MFLWSENKNLLHWLICAESWLSLKIRDTGTWRLRKWTTSEKNISLHPRLLSRFRSMYKKCQNKISAFFLKFSICGRDRHRKLIIYRISQGSIRGCNNGVMRTRGGPWKRLLLLIGYENNMRESYGGDI